MSPPHPGRPMPSGTGRRPGPGTDGFAIAALAAGMIGAPVGIGFGVIALSQLKRSGQRGRGMAIAGIVLSALWVVVIAVVLTSTVVTLTAGNAATASVRALRTGDCMNNRTGSIDFHSVATVSCARPHEGEAFAVFALDASGYPGPAEVEAQANDMCRGRFGDYSDADPFAERLYMIVPGATGWMLGKRDVVCIATPLDHGRTTGSLQAD